MVLQPLVVMVAVIVMMGKFALSLVLREKLIKICNQSNWTYIIVNNSKSKIYTQVAKFTKRNCLLNVCGLITIAGNFLFILL